VAAAASLTDVFTDIGAAFTQRNPQVAVTFSFAGSSTIAQQLREGAPIDVFASAGSNAMTPVVNDGLVGAVNDFTTNSLQIATPPDNPGQVTRLADLENVSVLVCATQVPCGAAAAMLFERNALTVSPVSFESDVRAVLTKIEAGEADAGIVYVTDVVAAGSAVAGVTIPADANVTSTYQAAAALESDHPAEAAAFVEFLSSPEAQQLLAAAGFTP